MFPQARALTDHFWFLCPVAIESFLFNVRLLKHSLKKKLLIKGGGSLRSTLEGWSPSNTNVCLCFGSFGALYVTTIEIDGKIFDLYLKLVIYCQRRGHRLIDNTWSKIRHWNSIIWWHIGSRSDGLKNIVFNYTSFDIWSNNYWYFACVKYRLQESQITKLFKQCILRRYFYLSMWFWFFSD